ncbi:MAG TPA: hypothetical protein VK831_04310 [Candidatus Deferrimicrobiaceae bacterium]|nr:hypothetical protein [Candidatus Deferrimicrobiaceae bacterium]
MIVVGTVTPSAPDPPAVLAIARRCAAAGARTEIVGSLPEGPAEDRRLIELATAGAGHAALRRTAAEPEPADVDLALRYLPDVRVIVLVRPARPLLSAAAVAAAWSGAVLVLVDESAGPDDLPVEPLVLTPPDQDPDETFAGFVAALAVRLDGGADAHRAWDETVAALAADRVERVGAEATARD